MKNIFETHNIEHLSPSSINLFITDPCMWIIRYLFGYKDNGNPAMWRGSCVDEAVGKMVLPLIENPNHTFKPNIDKLIRIAKEDYENYPKLTKKWYPEQIIDKKKFDKEKKHIGAFISTALQFYASFGAPTMYQKEVLLNLSSVEVPIKGFIDLQYGDIVRDIKTTLRKPSSVSDAHARQMSIYAKATESNHAILDYIVSGANENQIISMPVENIDDHILTIESVANSIKNMLSISDDKQKIATCFYPDFSSWIWGENEKRFAKLKIPSWR